jgi:4-carboxymuconolactone decarboxylase
VREDVRALIDVSLAVGLRDAFRLESALQTAVESATVEQIEETLLQSHLFAGYPAALNALVLWRRLSGVAAPTESTDDTKAWEERGRGTFEAVYGAQHERLLGNAKAIHPDLAQWMINDGYGKVIGRPGLDLVTRELCIIALLSVQDAVPQLYSHLRGALNVGASEDEVSDVVNHLAAALNDARRHVLEQQWAAVRARRQVN